MEKRFVTTPHPDIELGFKRTELEYFLTIPDAGVNTDTGLIFFISGFGDKADSEYQRMKLRPYLADNHNCITVGINYFGIGNRTETGATCITDNQFLSWFRRLYCPELGAESQNSLTDPNELFRVIKKRGLTELDSRCRFTLVIANGEYQSFGFLPAIDHLQVLGEILKQFKINRRRIIAYGTSYGGYIALLLGKFAPDTFSAIIDNSGFVKTDLRYIVGNELPELGEEYSREFNGLMMRFVTNSPWTVLDKRSPCFFSESCGSIRSLIHERHIAESETKYHIFHSVKDELSPIYLKERFVDILRAKNVRAYFKKVTSEDIDGRVFKDTKHGMNASMRGIFDLVAGLDDNSLCRENGTTDFDLKSVRRYECGNKTYVFKYDDTLRVGIETV